jgi:hypothetical protein
VKLLLDEMYAPAIAVALTERCLDVVAVAADAGLRGTSDADLLVHAATQQRALVTENIPDFMALATQWISEGWAHAGLILANPKKHDRATRSYPGNLVAALDQFLSDPPIQGESWIWWL